MLVFSRFLRPVNHSTLPDLGESISILHPTAQRAAENAKTVREVLNIE